MVHYNGSDTLVFSTGNFFLNNKEYFYEQKELAGLEQYKEVY